MTTRRRLMQGAGAASLAAFSGLFAARPVSAQDIKGWDLETDILCVGGGAASLTAATIAAAASADVVVVEKAPVLGGTTAKSGAVFWIPNHYLLREKGVEDARDDALRYMVRYSYPEYYDRASPTLGLDPHSYQLIAAFYDHGHVMVDRLVALNALRVRQYNSRFPDGQDPLDYQSEMEENLVPRGRPLCPMRADGSEGRGPDLISQYESYLKGAGAQIFTDHRVVGLITEQDRVIGAEVMNGGQKLHVRARKGVIFGTGGFSNNAELVRRHHQPFHYGSCASAMATGDIIPIAQSVSAQLAGMSEGWRTTVVFEEAVENRAMGTGSFMQPGDSMFVVDKYGRRVVNEKRNYNDRARVHQNYDANLAEYPNLLTFYIYDRRTAEAYAGNYPLPATGSQGRYVISGSTLSELAANIESRLDRYQAHTGGFALAKTFSAQLEKTFERYNELARSGRDSDFGRGSFDYDRQWSSLFAPMRSDTSWEPNEGPNNVLHPMLGQGPYYCIILALGLLDTNGGPIVNENAQILNQNGEPIPGLYGAGNCIASPARQAYYGAGGTIGLAMTYGYIAALHAVNASV